MFPQNMDRSFALLCTLMFLGYHLTMAESKIVLYFSTVSSNLEIKRHQQKIQMILDSKHISYDVLDISSNEEAKELMRELVGDPQALPPQVCNGDQYCGDFEAFENAVEDEALNEFLKL